ncbi:class I SAM-dependent methyltransferase [Shewanella sp. YLB-07]|uniref:class I SAM-dependent methyltransferase n=1 Tax=Shewanella sp. YLB-07 TaxID=2601268 RepID=UPI00128E6ACB|nr:class I SAM-dependent methyltransferase [Shewanella sp. YLB-07]MPY24234.1 class I SAM-dependent methyltransferase [Shewanella sp. YLB-07]
MRNNMFVAGVLVSATLSFNALAHSDGHGVSSLQQAVNSDFRQDKNASRDDFRHPLETLVFFDINPSDKVIELWPGGGWYAEILAPYLAVDGQYVAGNFDTQPIDEKKREGYKAKSGKKFETWLQDNRQQLGKATTVTFDPPTHYVLGGDASVDVVLTFRNLHNWAMKDQLEPVFESAYKVLKSGGTFGIVEHRAKAGMDAKTGYMDEAKVIALAEKVGFTLVAKSEINANIKDTKDYPKGVWTLPPRLALDDLDKEKYLAIGESDRMTLKFTKNSQ